MLGRMGFLLENIIEQNAMTLNNKVVHGFNGFSVNRILFKVCFVLIHL